MKVSLVLLSVAATALADAAAHQPAKREHHVHVAQLARRNETQTLAKRESFSGTATWYDVTTAAGACGDWMQPGEHVVALNSPQLNAYGGYQNGKPTSCGRSITIQYNGNTQQAVIKDECPPCAWGSLDLSAGLFSAFTDLGQGVFPLTWWFNDGDNSGSSNNNNNNNQQTTTSTPQWTPDPTPTTTSTSTTPTTSDTPTTTSTSSTPPPSSSPSSSSDSNSIQEAPATTSQVANNLDDTPAAVAKLAGFLRLAHGL